MRTHAQEAASSQAAAWADTERALLARVAEAEEASRTAAQQAKHAATELLQSHAQAEGLRGQLSEVSFILRPPLLSYNIAPGWLLAARMQTTIII